MQAGFDLSVASTHRDHRVNRDLTALHVTTAFATVTPDPTRKVILCPIEEVVTEHEENGDQK
jgi:hypothetical protein